jgi:hypothetical protein
MSHLPNLQLTSALDLTRSAERYNQTPPGSRIVMLGGGYSPVAAQMRANGFAAVSIHPRFDEIEGLDEGSLKDVVHKAAEQPNNDSWGEPDVIKFAPLYEEVFRKDFLSQPEMYIGATAVGALESRPDLADSAELCISPGYLGYLFKNPNTMMTARNETRAALSMLKDGGTLAFGPLTASENFMAVLGDSVRSLSERPVHFSPRIITEINSTQNFYAVNATIL